MKKVVCISDMSGRMSDIVTFSKDTFFFYFYLLFCTPNPLFYIEKNVLPLGASTFSDGRQNKFDRVATIPLKTAWSVWLKSKLKGFVFNQTVQTVELFFQQNTRRFLGWLFIVKPKYIYTKIFLRLLCTWLSLTNESREWLLRIALFLSQWHQSAVKRELSVKSGLGLVLGPWLIVHTQTRRYRTWRLIRVCIVC